VIAPAPSWGFGPARTLDWNWFESSAESRVDAGYEGGVFEPPDNF